jgi:hypothetical protein
LIVGIPGLSNPFARFRALVTAALHETASALPARAGGALKKQRTTAKAAIVFIANCSPEPVSV